MPSFELTQILPPYPLHWITILHYLLLVGTIALLTLAGDKASILYILVLTILGLAIGASAYSSLLPLPRIFIFLIRVVIFGVPIVIAGMGASEESRTVSGILAVIALPILVVTFITCWLGPIGDPRLAGWCR